jgi:predicted RNase H-like HicB family nuclease
MQSKYRFTVVVEKDQDGYYAYCPQLQGCYSQGDTYEESLVNIEDVIKLHLADREADQEDWRTTKFFNVTSLEVAV